MTTMRREIVAHLNFKLIIDAIFKAKFKSRDATFREEKIMS